LVQLLDQYLADLDAGRQPDRTRLIADHPHLAPQLEQALAGLDFIRQAAGPEWKVPTQLGDYRILREVGQGGMGVVYEAEQISLRRRVALKVLRFGAVADEMAMQRFQREAETVAHLHHTNIAPIYSVGSEEGVRYYAMQFIDGCDLAERSRRALEEERPIPPRDLADWGLQAAEALAHAHQRGVIHRDIKPSNLILDAEGRIWLTDFGLARRVDDVALSVAGSLLGTPRYMSPEQARASKDPVDHRTDIYSLGATLYELATGRPIFDAVTPHEVISQILNMEPQAPRQVAPEVPRDLETIILKCLSKEAGHRYATAQDLADDLRAFLDGRAISARPPSLPERALRWARRHRKTAATAGTSAAVSLFVIVGAWLGWHQQRQARLGELVLKTDGVNLVAEVLDEAGEPVRPAFPVPTPEPIDLPEGSYQVRLSASGLLSETWPIDIHRGTLEQPSVSLSLSLSSRWLWPPREISSSALPEMRVARLDGTADMILLTQSTTDRSGKRYEQRLQRLDENWESYANTSTDFRKYNAMCRPRIALHEGSDVLVLCGINTLYGWKTGIGEPAWPPQALGFEPLFAPDVVDEAGQVLLIERPQDSGAGGMLATELTLIAWSLADQAPSWEARFAPVYPNFSTDLDYMVEPPRLLWNLDQDSNLEVVLPVGRQDSWNYTPRASAVKVLDAATGASLWESRLMVDFMNTAHRAADQMKEGPDLDGDGRREVFVSWTGYEDRAGRGSVYVAALSGQDGRKLWQWSQPMLGPALPLQWWQAGEDGFPMLAVPVEMGPGGQRMSYFVSSATGRTQHTLSDVSNLVTEDFDGDGVKDLYYTVSPQGAARHLAARGQLPVTWRRLGTWNAGGDYDRDGCTDLVSLDQGRLSARSGRDGNALWTSAGTDVERDLFLAPESGRPRWSCEVGATPNWGNSMDPEVQLLSDGAFGDLPRVHLAGPGRAMSQSSCRQAWPLDEAGVYTVPAREPLRTTDMRVTTHTRRPLPWVWERQWVRAYRGGLMTLGLLAIPAWLMVQAGRRRSLGWGWAVSTLAGASVCGCCRKACCPCWGWCLPVGRWSWPSGTAHRGGRDRRRPGRHCRWDRWR